MEGVVKGRHQWIEFPAFLHYKARWKRATLTSEGEWIGRNTQRQVTRHSQPAVTKNLCSRTSKRSSVKSCQPIWTMSCDQQNTIRNHLQAKEFNKWISNFADSTVPADCQAPLGDGGICRQWWRSFLPQSCTHAQVNFVNTGFDNQYNDLGALLLTWINFNPSMDE